MIAILATATLAATYLGLARYLRRAIRDYYRHDPATLQRLGLGD